MGACEPPPNRRPGLLHTIRSAISHRPTNGPVLPRPLTRPDPMGAETEFEDRGAHQDLDASTWDGSWSHTGRRPEDGAPWWPVMGPACLGSVEDRGQGVDDASAVDAVAGQGALADPVEGRVPVVGV